MARKAAFVIQRYGSEVIGGAETAARQLAEHLAGDAGWDITVYTTRARDYHSWRNEYQPGEETIGRIRVRRFGVRFARGHHTFRIYNSMFKRIVNSRETSILSRVVLPAAERLWFVLQGPYAPGLVRALRRDAETYDCAVLFTYLYYPTVAGIESLRRPAVLIPAAHDEPSFYFPRIRRLFRTAGMILCYTEPERRLIHRVHEQTRDKTDILGHGFDGFDGERPKRQPQPYLLYLGRVTPGKNLEDLSRWFTRYLERHPSSSLELRLAGERAGGLDLAAHPRIRVTGPMSDNEKEALIGNALCVVNPSPRESLSMIVMEAIAARVPVLVNARCEVLAWYTQVTETVRGFTGREEFISALRDVETADWTGPEKKAELDKTRRWAAGRYSWSAVLAKMETACEGLHSGRRSPAPGAVAAP